MIGTSLGAYRVLGKLGEGGMGEVYRARDTKLNRDVAIKVLPEVFAADAGRLARFTQEAQTLAALNHPNIAAIYGVEETANLRALVMELVEGEDLSVRMERGPMPSDEALPIARQIAEALEFAHEQGIVHRDLKPANVKVKGDGTVKVLDFGLAKAMDPGVASNFDAATSPTLTSPAAETRAGVVLGTAAYMAPEQARGKPVDKRADIWAFGVVLYEMLTGRRLFDGETMSDVLAAALTREPDFSALPETTPAQVETLLRRCLERDPRTRLRDIGEARVALGGSAMEAPAARRQGSPPTAWRRALPWALAAALSGVAGIALWNTRKGPAPSLAPLRLQVELTDDATVRVADQTIGSSVVLSPQGDRLVFVTADGGPIHVRRLDSLTATPLVGTDGGTSPFFSPDGEWIAFFAHGRLKKVALAGGAVTDLADAQDPRGGAWLEDGTILFTPRVESALLEVSASGGALAPFTTLDTGAGERTHRWPDELPGRRGILFTAHTKTGNYDDASLVVMKPDGSRRKIVSGGSYGRYLSSGHIVYLHESTLFVVPFDLDRLEPAGPAVPFIQGVMGATQSGTADFSVSRNGLLAYVPKYASTNVIVWLDRAGQTRPLRGETAAYEDLRLSPQGDRLALVTEEQGRSNVWVLDLRRDALSRLTFDPINDLGPEWTPDGQRITYLSWRDDVGALNLFWQRADGTGEPARLTTSRNRQGRGSWHPSGRFLAFAEIRPGTVQDLMVLPMEGDETSGLRPGVPAPFLATPFQELEPQFSPDGRWLAYTSNESGSYEVYVRPFPGPGGRWQISKGSGGSPRWSRSKRELYYKVGTRLMVVDYDVVGGGASFAAGTPRPWADVPLGTRAVDWDPYGERIALIRPAPGTGGRPPAPVFVFNVLDELRRRVPRTGAAGAKTGTSS